MTTRALLLRTSRAPLWAAAAAAVIALSGCGDADPEELPTSEAAEAEAADGLDEAAEPSAPATAGAAVLTAEELLAAPQNHVDQPVVVDGVVDQVLSPGIFTLTTAEADVVGGEPGHGTGFVVIGPDDDVTAGDAIRITGTVRDGVEQADLDAQHLPAWDDGVLAEYVDRPWLEAESLEMPPG